MVSFEYEQYIASPQWAAFKARYFATHARACAVCGARQVQLHHLTYARLGYELPSDVVPLCDDHHRAVHDYARATGSDLEAATYAFIRPRVTATRVSPERMREIKREITRRDLRALGRFLKRVLFDAYIVLLVVGYGVVILEFIRVA